MLAAPLLVHSLIGLVPGSVFRQSGILVIMVIIIAVLLAIVALIIDRRALLVSALIYVGGVIAFVLKNAYALSRGTPVDGSFILIATLVILGALVLALCIGWAPLRRA